VEQSTARAELLPALPARAARQGHAIGARPQLAL